MRILVTGGAGFIGGAVVRKLLKSEDNVVFNLDKLGYASDLTSINELNIKDISKKYFFINIDLSNAEATNNAVRKADPDLIMHLAAESHVDRSIDSPRAFLESNVLATFNLLEAAREHFANLPIERKNIFRFQHISTDEVFGSLGYSGKFSENTPYDPRSPYSSTKASSDHLVRAWYHTYNLPVVITNCSNNFGPWQFPEKLIPVVILKAINNQSIPLYGDGQNIRDWLFVEDHVEALVKVSKEGIIGESYCVGGNSEKTNLEIIELICEKIDLKLNCDISKKKLIKFVSDRPGHDKRYAINAEKIQKELKWNPTTGFEKGLDLTIDWYIKNQDWCKKVSGNKFYTDSRNV